MTPGTLAEQCREVESLTDQAIEWLRHESNAERVGREKDTLSKTMRRAGARARRLKHAALRPMSVGVFGPSQAGKSYLVEVLARPEHGSLKAKFDGMEPVDFLTEINPIGEKESTGLVTRFTSQAMPQKAPAGFPVRLRLLSETDIVKILGNTFFLDGDQTKEPETLPEELTLLFSKLGQRGATQTDGLGEDDLLDIQEYFQKQFGRESLIAALYRLWTDGVELLPRLTIDGRAEFFSFLWGRHQAYTALFRKLAEAIVALGRADEAFAPIGALIPREGSILDVATLGGIGQSADDDLIELRTASGASFKLSRPLVAALTAELCIEVAEAPRPLFKDTDLLDFPGARSRQKIDLKTFFEEKADALKETFLRGKVAYLFDRYVVDQELTSMLLCIRPSNMEVVTLPNLVADWIESTHGATAEARREQRNLLFLVLTWFDTHFVDKAGDVGTDVGLRFRNRLEASLLGSFGKAHSWPQQWTPGKPFQNTFWFRNPNYPADAIIRYENRREVEFLPNKVARIDELRTGFVGLAEAHNHFIDPARAFDEALKLNDGGISYIAENLEKICKPEIKLQQIKARLDDLRHDLRASLTRFYVSLDVEKRIEERRAAADNVFASLEHAVQQRRFGSLIRALLLDPIDLTNILYGVLQTTVVTQPVQAAAPGPRVRRASRPELAAPSDAGEVQQSDRETRLARAAIDYWILRSRGIVDDAQQLERLGLTNAVAQDIVDELIALGNRTRLETNIAADLRLFLSFDQLQQASVKSALIATTHINRLTGDLGFGKLTDAQRPVVDDGVSKRIAFAGRSIAFDTSGIGREPKKFAETYATDWFNGFDRIVEDNARNEQGITVDLAQNQNLKVILDGLDLRGIP